MSKRRLVNDPVIQFAAVHPGGLVGLFRYPVFVLGKYVQNGRKITIDRNVIEQVRKNFTARNVEVPISYEHTIENPDIAMGEPIRAAGWLKELEDAPVQEDGSGLWVLWGWGEPTDLARKLITAREIQYTSPAFSLHYDDHHDGEDQGATLLSLAVTNRPFLDTPAIQFSAVSWEAAATPAKETPVKKKKTFKKATVSAINSGDQKGNLLIEHSDFPPKSGDGDDETSNAYFCDAGDVRDALGIGGGDDDDSQMSAATRERLGKIVTLSGVSGATEVNDAVVTAIATKVSAAGARRPVVEMSAVPKKDGKLDFLSLDIPAGHDVSAELYRSMVADNKFNAAMQKGLVLPAERELFLKIAMSDPNTFDGMLAVRKTPIVNMSANGTPGNPKRGDKIALSAAEKKAAKALGVTEKAMLATKQARLSAAGLAGAEKDDEEDADQ